MGELSARERNTGNAIRVAYMANNVFDRCDFLKTVLAGIPPLKRDCDAFPRGQNKPGGYAAVIPSNPACFGEITKTYENPVN
jgi:hypothetical protein